MLKPLPPLGPLSIRHRLFYTELVAHDFCSAYVCSLYSDSPAFEPSGEWDGKTRRIAVNARLLDDLEAADCPVTVIDGKNLW